MCRFLAILFLLPRHPHQNSRILRLLISFAASKMTHNELKSKAMTKLNVIAEYYALAPEFNLIREMLLARKNAG